MQNIPPPSYGLEIHPQSLQLPTGGAEREAAYTVSVKDNYEVWTDYAIRFSLASQYPIQGWKKSFKKVINEQAESIFKNGKESKAISLVLENLHISLSKTMQMG